MRRQEISRAETQWRREETRIPLVTFVGAFFSCRFARVARCREARSRAEAHAHPGPEPPSRARILCRSGGVSSMRVLIWPFYSGGGGGRRSALRGSRRGRTRRRQPAASRRRRAGVRSAREISLDFLDERLPPGVIGSLHGGSRDRSPSMPRVRWTISLVGGSISGECRRAGLFARHTEPAAAPEVVRSVKTTLQGPTHKFLIPCRGCSDCGTYVAASKQRCEARRISSLFHAETAANVKLMRQPLQRLHDAFLCRKCSCRGCKTFRSSPAGPMQTPNECRSAAAGRKQGSAPTSDVGHPRSCLLEGT